MKIRKNNLSQTDTYTLKHSNPPKVTIVGSDKALDHQNSKGFLSNSKFCHNIGKLLIELPEVKRITLYCLFVYRSVEKIFKTDIFLETFFESS